MLNTTTTMPSLARSFRSFSTTLPTSPMPPPSTNTSPAGTAVSHFMCLAVSSMTLPFSATQMWSAAMPMSWASRLWICSIRCSPWRGMKNRGRVRAWMIFSSSWQAWPLTWSISALSYTTSAPRRNSSLIIRPTVTSLPGMALAERITLSPGPMSTCLWLPKAMRYNALISSPWEPVVTITCCLAGSCCSRFSSISVPLGTFM